jgi:phenylalanyl-tRNA synthetase beta chain
MKGIFAPEGSYIPGTGITLKKGNIRGVDSCGMMVSEREMGLSEDHEGIIDLPDDTVIGTPFAEIYRLNDPVIEIGLTPNRGDCAGVYGIARDLAAGGHGTLKPLETAPVAATFETPIAVALKTQDCPHFVGRLIRNVKNGPSPEWMRDRLNAVGQKSISALVDITNYMTLGLNRPLHVFDADKIKGSIHVRAARKGESFRALNGKDYVLDEGMVVVCDDSGVLALGGVIGGESTAVDEHTKNVYVEAAYFNPLRTARTGRALQIDSDARYRFERGIDPAFTQTGMEIATRMILDLCGGEAGSLMVAGDAPVAQKTIAFDPAYTKKLAGLDLEETEQLRILTALGFAVAGNAAPYTITAPSWRPDIEGAPDLVEEIVRIHGYDTLPATSVPRLHAITRSGESRQTTRARKARIALALAGMDECVTWSFMDSTLAKKFISIPEAQAKALTLSNPISSEMDFMRPTILPNLIAAAGRNEDRGFPCSALFEVGPVFVSQKPSGQHIHASGVRIGTIGPRHWSSKETNRAVDAYDAKADAISVLKACGLPAGSGQVTAEAPTYFHPGRSGSIKLGNQVVARFGEIHPALLEAMKITGPVAAFEVILDAIPTAKAKGTAKPLLTLSPFQPLTRDFAFIVDTGVEGDAIVRAMRGVDKTLIGDITIFDVYQGKGVEPGKKSVALSVTIQPVQKTLTDAEIEALCAKIIDTVAAKTGGVLRG